MSSETIGSARGIEFLAWLELNKRRVIAGAALFALLASGITLYRWWSAQREIDANSALVEVELRKTTAGVASPDSKAEEFLDVSSRYASTQAGQRALLLAAAALFREGKYSESQRTFEQFRSGNEGDPLKGTAAFGIAACLEAQGKTDEAIAAYREVAAAYPDSAVSAQSQLALAGLFDSKNEPQQALQYYDQLRTTVWMNEAESSRQALLARHPELAPTNSNPAEASTPELAAPISSPE